MYRLYVIPGSHACRSAMLMLEHKQVPYRRIELITMLHPIAARLHGFDAGGQTRSIGGRRTLALRIADRLGTVPGLVCDDQRISTNHRIARFLDERHPEPPLFPADPERRSEVEEAERWANETLQMDARRITTAAVRSDASAAIRLGADGRLGHLLFRRALARRILIPTLVCGAFAPGPATERKLLAELPAALDRIDGWIADGVLGGAQLNAADFMIAPSLALILYRPDVRPVFAGRPSLELVDRLLPEPGAAQPHNVVASPGLGTSGRSAKSSAARALGRALRMPGVLDRKGTSWVLQALSPAPVIVLVHRGRNSGRVFKTPLEMLLDDRERDELIISPMWGRNSDWYRNVLAGGLVEVHVGGEQRQVTWRELNDAERSAALDAYRRAHPTYSRMILRTLARVNDLKGDPHQAVLRELPMLGLRRAES